MARYYYEDSRWPWRPDAFLRRFLKKHRKQRKHRRQRKKIRALDLGMGYGRNALWLAEQGFEVEAWELDRRYVAEARREAKRRGVELADRLADNSPGPEGVRSLSRARLPQAGESRGTRLGDFTRARFRGPYEVIVISNALHHVRRSQALRVLRRARRGLAPGGLLFLLVKLTRDRYFRLRRRDPNWSPVRGERNTLRRVRGPAEYRCWRGRRKQRASLLSALEPAEVRRALRGLQFRHYRETVLRSEWVRPAVTHHVAEIVAQKPEKGRPR
ncbi:methyltransferase domain-containing protein [Acidobacteriia bacterium AH_259_A11_L15]|nr:methyltransferase domain-containing protein [Acidobacteriia bacterium AH_259_A11_L15]